MGSGFGCFLTTNPRYDGQHSRCRLSRFAVTTRPFREKPIGNRFRENGRSDLLRPASDPPPLPRAPFLFMNAAEAGSGRLRYRQRANTGCFDENFSASFRDGKILISADRGCGLGPHSLARIAKRLVPIATILSSFVTACGGRRALNR